MSLLPGHDGLRLDQAPPLSIPARFFATIPVTFLAIGLLLLWHGGAALTTRWAAPTVALTHLLTLGLAAMAMIGALYQMIPVVAGVPVTQIGLAKPVHALLVVGLTALVSGLLAPTQWIFHVAQWTLGGALAGFLLPVALATMRAPTKSPTVTGMRMALAAAITLLILGLLLAWQYASGVYSPHRPLLLTTHALVGTLGWVGTLVVAVSWQVLPMFYLCAPPSSRAQNSFLIIIAASLGLAVLATLASVVGLPLGPLPPQQLVAWLALPAGAVVWGAAPLFTLRALRKRKRPRKDASLRFWFGSQVAAIATAAGVLLTLAIDDERALLATAWVAAVGWAAGTIHGMLTRIVPFLVWFHRFSALVGLQSVPPMNRLWPDRWARAGSWAHATLLLLGLAAIGLQSDTLARLSGLAAAATALCLAVGLYKVLSAQPVAAATTATAIS